MKGLLIEIIEVTPSAAPVTNDQRLRIAIDHLDVDQGLPPGVQSDALCHRDKRPVLSRKAAGVFSASSPFAMADATREALNITNSEVP